MLRVACVLALTYASWSDPPKVLQWKLPRLLESDTRVDECLKQLLLLILQCGWVAKGHKTGLLTLYHESHTWPTLAGLFST